MKNLILSTLILICIYPSNAQEVLMQGWYWDYPKTVDGANWTDTLDQLANHLGEVGVTHMWLPPMSRASFGNGSNGYDPQDLYDLGEYGGGATGLGTRAQLDDLITALNNSGIETVADVVYNHRDGGAPEANPAVEGWIENYNCTKVDAGDQPFPSDRVRYILPIGGSTGNGATTYYFKVRSASKHPNFYDREYKFYIETNTTGFQNLPALTENEGNNGGGDCGQASDVVPLGVDMIATVDNVGDCAGGCGLDEFAVTLDASDYAAAGDSLYIYMVNTNGGYSDHYISFIWNGTLDVQSQLVYETYTDFTDMPSGQGAMDYTNFKPNGNPTQLNGDYDTPLFFYDYDQSVTSTIDALTDWTEYLWDDVDVRGLRMDAVKHFDFTFVGNLMDDLHDAGKDPSMVIGEFYDFNPFVLNDWVSNVETNMDADTKDAIDVRVFDFALRESLKNASDLFGYDVRNMYNSGIVGATGAAASRVVTFANNHDFRDGDQPIQNDPLLAYAYLLTNRSVGTPTIYYPDYTGTTIPNAPDDHMGPDIDKMMLAYDTYLTGGTTDYLNRFSTPYTIDFNSGVASAALIYQISNGGINSDKDAIIMINYAGEPLDVELPMSNGSSIVSGTLFSDISGKGLIPYNVTDENNLIRLAIPARSYGIWISEDNNSTCPTAGRIYVDKNATGLNNGTTWTDAYTSLEAAVYQTQICTDIDEVWVKEGTYNVNYRNSREESLIFTSGVTVRGGFPSAGNPTIADYDPVAHPTIISGDIGLMNDNSDNSYNIIKVISPELVSIYGLTLTDANANGNTSATQSAAGLLNEGVLHLEDCTIEDNTAVLDGSAMILGFGSTAQLVNNNMLNNTGGTSQVVVKENATMNVSENNAVQN